MSRFYNTLLTLVVISLISTSCTKNELEGLELTENPFEKWETISPIKINSAFRTNCKVDVRWTIEQEFLDILNESDVPFADIRLWRNNKLRATISGGRRYFFDHPCAPNTKYEISLFYGDGKESIRSLPAYSN